MEEETYQPKGNKNLTNIERQRIVEILLQQSVKGTLPKGIIQQTASEFNVSRKTIGKLWKLAKQLLEKGQVLNMKNKMIERVGRKKHEYDLSKLSEIPLHRRTNIRSLAKALGVGKSTAHRLVQKGKIKSHSSAIKPFLTQDNMRKRLVFCLSKLQPTNTNSDPIFEPLHNYVHIDEKWFFMSKTSQKYYLHPTEDEPQRSCKSKRFITKVMFLAAVVRPIFGSNGEVIFDGKLGIFPFTIVEPAKRKSKNRAVGVLETKPIASITKKVIKACLLEKVLPTIKERWPQGANRVIYIQQDNARPHIDINDPDFVKVAQEDGFDIRMTCQPPNSPDLNVLDLGFFRAIQALQYESAPKTVVELVEVVTKAYEDLDPSTLNKVWLSLQYCMIEIMKCKGSNDYKLPHVGKDRMQRLGTLPNEVQPDSTLIQSTMNYLNDGAIYASHFVDTLEVSQFIIEDEDHLQE